MNIDSNDIEVLIQGIRFIKAVVGLFTTYKKYCLPSTKPKPPSASRQSSNKETPRSAQHTTGRKRKTKPEE